MICEMPIDIEGLYEISSALLDWTDQVHAREIVILDGVGVSGIPDQREAYSVADETRIKQLEQKGISAIQSAMISGVGGSILNQCLTRRVSGVSLLTPVSIEIPDSRRRSCLDQIYKPDLRFSISEPVGSNRMLKG